MDPKPKAITDILSRYDVVFFIPPYQRNYAWHKATAEGLFRDLEASIEKGSKHFFGTVVVEEKTAGIAQAKEFVLVDGQQG